MGWEEDEQSYAEEMGREGIRPSLSQAIDSNFMKGYRVGRDGKKDCDAMAKRKSEGICKNPKFVKGGD